MILSSKRSAFTQPSHPMHTKMTFHGMTPGNIATKHGRKRDYKAQLQNIATKLNCKTKLQKARGICRGPFLYQYLLSSTVTSP